MKYILFLGILLIILSGCSSENNEVTGDVVVMVPKGEVLKDEFIISEVSSHNSKESCYTIIDSKVYNLTEWIGKHPGGENAILKICGLDGTLIFRAQHDNNPKQVNQLEEFFIGNLV